MKRYEVVVNVEGLNNKIIEYIDLDDDLTDEEIESECREVAFEYIDWNYKVIENGE